MISPTISDVIDALGYVRPLAHSREDWIKIGMAIKAEFGDSGLDAWLDWSAEYKKFKPAEARTVWRSFRKGGIGIGTLFKAAMDAGWQPRQENYSPAELARLELARIERAAQVEAQAEADAAEVALWEQRVAEASWAVWCSLSPGGRSAYLKKKGIDGVALRHVVQAVLLVWHDDRIEVLREGADIKAAFRNRGEKPVRFFRRGDVVVPVCEPLEGVPGGRVVNLQIITAAGTKKFLKFGRKSGCFCLIGPPPKPGEPLAVCEGYATGESIHAAKGWPVFVVFDCGNMPTVAHWLREAYPKAVVFWCADNDAGVKGNPGVTKATEAAGICPGAVVVPRFGGRPLV